MTESQFVIPSSLEPGTLVAGRYLIEQLIGTGGMATVYRAFDQQKNNRAIAIKMLHPQFASDNTYVERFKREVDLMNKVSDKNVVQTIESGEDQGSFFFTMEYVRADSLEKIMESRSLTERQAAQLTIEVCKGLQAIHREGIIHRDLKPANILVLDDGSVKIVDFGVAREKYSRLTAKTQKVGSVCYMAPEIWLGKKPTSSVDFYSLGVVLYELATGVVPFEHEWPGEVMRQHIEEAVKPPVEINSKVPNWLNELIVRLLAKSPRGRPKSAEEVIVFVKLYGPLTYTDRSPGIVEAPLIPDRKAFKDLELSHESGYPERQGKRTEIHKGKTYVLSLTATRLLDASALEKTEQYPRRKVTVVVPLPRRAAMVLEIESPSRDFIFLGIFLASLQVFDWVLTHMGVSRFGAHAEGNPVLRYIMSLVGPERTLLVVKVAAIILVVFLTDLAKRTRWIKNLISVLSFIYFFAAVLPWIYLLYLQENY